ncbi:hypothetical protein CLOM_g21629 [Closterium sp. NIES-68]|nr:hypothetical protein CLOM_g21629 [Closterium sp. NIES-68]GJP72923.1 hypothetical protein CLOP_g3693 [Closterium sp. NIES-67]
MRLIAALHSLTSRRVTLLAQIAMTKAKPPGRAGKDASKTKYYAVRKGHQPGIYLTWPECQRQVTNFKGNQHKSFPTLDQALSYLALANVFVSSPPQHAAEAPNQGNIHAAAAAATTGYAAVAAAEDRAAAGGGNAESQGGGYARSFGEGDAGSLGEGNAGSRGEGNAGSRGEGGYSAAGGRDGEEGGVGEGGSVRVGGEEGAVKVRRGEDMRPHIATLGLQIDSQALYRMEFDGASKGNPGRAGAGSVLWDERGSELVCMREGVGHGTCNMAEYRAFIGGLELALALGITRLHVQGDSMLVVMQVQKKWKVNAEMLREPCKHAQQLVCQFQEIAIRHVPRECNQLADLLSNEAVPLAEDQRVIVPSSSTTRFLHGNLASASASASAPSPKPIPRRGRPPKIQSKAARQAQHT